MPLYLSRNFVSTKKPVTITGPVKGHSGFQALQQPVYFGDNREFRMQYDPLSMRLQYQMLIDDEYVTKWEFPE